MDGPNIDYALRFDTEIAKLRQAEFVYLKFHNIISGAG
jgi:hypothetical protein